MQPAALTPGVGTAEGARPPRALELSSSRLRLRFADAFVPRPWIYWVDLLLSAGLGWSAFALAGWTAGAARLVALGVATLALYRAVLFIHELAHLRPGAVPGFETAWNALVGCPMMAPSLMYVGSHADHHKRSTYGTEGDPEYESIAHWSRLRIAASTVTMLVVPAALAFRFGVLGPISRAIPPLRRRVVQSMSTLVINPRYRRQAPRGRNGRRWALCEAGAALYFWSFGLAIATGRLSPAWAGRWYAVACGILVLNHLRTLVAHRYENRGERMDVISQLVDTVNLRGVAGFTTLTALAAPVGLRYHGLHHLVPAVPYHSLGWLHRQLLAELPAASPYRSTQEPTLVSALRKLWERARRNAAAGSGGAGGLARLSGARAGAEPEAGRATPIASDAGAAAR